MREEILKEVEDAVRAANCLKEERSLIFMEQASLLIADAYRNGGKVLIGGNGGSLCDAMHFAEELTGFFRGRERRALPALALSDPGHMSCVSNDIGYKYVFSRAVEAFGKKEDVFVALTTSGNSENILEAVAAAKKIGMKTIAFLGKDGGKMRGSCTVEWIVSGFAVADHVQEAHMSAIHIIIGTIEKILAKSLVKELLHV